MRLFLIGFMGSGKSRTGEKLAQLLQYPFVDLDEWIIDHAQMSIPLIFREKGEAYFRQLETKALRAQGRKSQLVIACGGGAPCFYDNMAWMNKNGITIFLDATPELLYQRLASEADSRPLLNGKSKEELLEFIRHKMQERLPFYKKALLHVFQESNENDLPEQILKKMAGIRRS